MSDNIYSIKEISNSALMISMLSRMELIRCVRATLTSFAEKFGLSRQGICDAELAVNEALANIIEHAYENEVTGLIEMSIDWDDVDGLIVNIRDFGKKSDPSCFKSRDLDDLSDSGLGVYLMQNLMDEVSFNTEFDDGTSITLKKKSR